MPNEQRTAMARIISDMIKTDDIIDESEIRRQLLTRLKFFISTLLKPLQIERNWSTFATEIRNQI